MNRIGAFLLVVMVLAGVAFAAEKREPVKVAIAGGEYWVEGDAMVVQLDYPMANNRDTMVGNYVPAPTGGQKLNMDQEKDLTAAGRQLREQLLSIKLDSGLYALRSVIVQYSTVVLTKYPRVEWAEIIKTVEAGFKEAAPGKKVKK